VALGAAVAAMYCGSMRRNLEKSAAEAAVLAVLAARRRVAMVSSERLRVGERGWIFMLLLC
jgi:hypothetical protein